MRVTFLASLFLALLTASTIARFRPDPAALAQEPLLQLGVRLEGKLAGGETRRFLLKLKAGEFARLVVTQLGVDVVVRLLDANDKELAAVDSPNGNAGDEVLFWVAQTGGVLRLEVRSLDAKVAAGQYRIELVEVRQTATGDEILTEAQQKMGRGNQLRKQKEEEKALWQAIEEFKAAGLLWSEAGETQQLAHSAFVTGWTLASLGKVREARKAYELVKQAYVLVRDEAGIAMVEQSLSSLKATIDAAQIFAEAEALKKQETEESSQRAIDLYLSAAKLYRNIKDGYFEFASLVQAGILSLNLWENQKALEYFGLALSLSHTLKDRDGELSTLNIIGLVYDRLGENQKALESYGQALPLVRERKDRQSEVATLSKICGVYSNMGEVRKALDYCEQALTISRAENNRQGEATTLTNIGRVYSNLGDHHKALNFYEQSLPISQAVGNRQGEAITLASIGAAHAHLGERQKALAYYEQALAISRAVKDPLNEAATLDGIGVIYSDLGDSKTALTYYEQALTISRTVKDRRGEEVALGNIGAIHSHLGDNHKALEYYIQALTISRVSGNRRGEAAMVGMISTVFFDLGDKLKSLNLSLQSLSLIRSVGDKGGEAQELSNLGTNYYALGNKQKAFEHYSQALPIFRAVGDRDGDARTLGNLMYILEDQQQLRVAVYYGKQSVNRYQELRAAISGLDKVLQRSFLKSREDTYRVLADLLIALGRLPEAQQVLDLLKEEEYFSYVRRAPSEADALTGRATLTPTEARLEKEYAEIADQVAALGKELEELNRLTQPLPTQLARRTDVDGKLRLATERFQAFLGRLEKELGNNKDAGERLTQIQTSEGFQDTLRELGAGTVALYTVVGEKKYSVILTPGSGPQVAAETNITREELNKKIFALKDALRNPRVDPRPLAAELYNILIAPIEKNLEGAKAETLMFSLDGALRYLPMAALYDAKRGQYLIERYRMVIYTPAGASDLKNPSRANWRALGFGVSKAVKNDEVGSFNALSGVPLELRSVIRSGQQTSGVMEGEVYLDDQFTEQRFNDALRTRQFPLIHIASHFSFKPGDSLKSFLLLGDGKPLTMEKLRGIPTLFSGVDLLALSACDTGVGEKDQEGREVEGFGVLAQRKGAKAVLATLWPVADESTAKLMSEFYRLRESKRGTNKAEALRQAQLALLTGAVRASSDSPPRSSENVGETKGGKSSEYKRDPAKPFAHPYYWAPFILIGNWL